MSMQRGALIVVEGLDRVGKSTQCRRLVEALNQQGHVAELMRFPDRSTAIGQVINGYLTSSAQSGPGSTDDPLDDRLVHLLFSCNRWELVPHMRRRISAGVSLLVDRYAFSGAAYSASKAPLPLSWCCHSDSGLPRPDMVLFLTLSPEMAQKRAGYGAERYETREFQCRVADNYERLFDESYWRRVDADGTIDEVFQRLLAPTLQCITAQRPEQLDILWPDKT